MPATRFVEALNEQIANELGASHQYLAVAVHYAASTLPQLASFFYRQAVEERNHALMMIQYLLDSGAPAWIPAVGAPRSDFADVVAPLAIALEEERKVADQIGGLVSLAREEGDYMSEQFMAWFLKEQVEEIATMSELAEVAERTRDNPMLLEEYIAREHPGEEREDPTAPPVAGASP